MHTFTTKPDGFRQIKRTLLFRDFPLFFLAIGSGISVGVFEKPGSETDWTVLACIYLALAVIGVVMFMSILSKERQQYEDLLLSIDEHGITRENYSTATLTIANEDVSKIYKKRDGGFIIQGPAGTDAINIPPGVEEADKLERLLAGIKPFSELSLWVRYKYLPFIVVISLVAALHLSSNKWLAITSGAILLGIYGYSLYRKYQYNSIAYISKWNIFFVLNVVFIIVRRMYTVFTGG